MTKYIYVLTGYSESSDRYGPTVFTKKPTDEQISHWCHYHDGHFGEIDGYEKGPGYDGSYVYPEVTKKKVE